MGKLLRLIRRFNLLHKCNWINKHSTRLFFRGKTRQGITYYKECNSCGKIEEN